MTDASIVEGDLIARREGSAGIIRLNRPKAINAVTLEMFHDIDRAVAYMGGRSAFGRHLKEFQALQFRVADMATELEAARTFLWRAASALDVKAPEATKLCAMAKRFATDIGFDVANQALQLHGGYGYLSEYGIEKIVRDLRVHQILEGTNEIMRVIVAREIFGR
jgi:alkylation response protein AidB-like acyl-CoA dehydrogenase